MQSFRVAAYIVAASNICRQTLRPVAYTERDLKFDEQGNWNTIGWERSGDADARNDETQRPAPSARFTVDSRSPAVDRTRMPGAAMCCLDANAAADPPQIPKQSLYARLLQIVTVFSHSLAMWTRFLSREGTIRKALDENSTFMCMIHVLDTLKFMKLYNITRILLKF